MKESLSYPHVVQQYDESTPQMPLKVSKKLMRQLSPEEKQEIGASATTLLKEKLFSKDDLEDYGQVQDDILEKANSYLTNARMILGDVHSNLNTALIMIQNVQQMKLNNVFTIDLLLSIVYEGLGVAGVAAPEEAETPVAIGAAILKVIAQAVERYIKTKAMNTDLLTSNQTISFLLDQIVMAKDQIDSLKELTKFHPKVAQKFASLTAPARPALEALKISGNIEFILLKSIIKKMGGVLALRATDQLNINKNVRYESTAHYKKAKERHQDPKDNWFLLYGSYEKGILPFHPTADYACYWKVLRLEDVADEAIRHTLDRMITNGIPKERLYSVGRSGDLLISEKSQGARFQINVIE